MRAAGRWAAAPIVATAITLGGTAVALAQEEEPRIGLDEETEQAHRLFLRESTVTLAPRDLRLAFSAGYQSDAQTFFPTRVDSQRASGVVALDFGILPSVELSASLPVVYRKVEREDVAGNSSEDETVGIGNPVVGGRVLLRRESIAVPEIVGTLDVLVPATDEALGTKDFGTSIGVFSSKRFDPAFVFGSLSWIEIFGDSDSLGYRFGVGFAVRHDLTLGGELSGGRNFDAELFQGEDTASLRNRVTFVVSRQVIIEPSVTFGLNEDTPDFSYNLLFSYRF